MPALSEEERSALYNCPLFRDLDPAPLLPLLGGRIVPLSAGESLLRVGEVWDQVAIVLSGTLNAFRVHNGERDFLYQQIFPSWLAGGEIVCTPRKTCPYEISAREDSRLWVFPWAVLDADAPLSPEQRLALTRNLLQFVSNLNICKYYKIEALSIRSARERILKYLTVQALRAGSCSFDIPMDREEMANYLCLNRTALSHELKRMETDGLIHFRRNHFVLSDTCCPLPLRPAPPVE